MNTLIQHVAKQISREIAIISHAPIMYGTAPSEARIAEIIMTGIEPLIQLLRDSKRTHVGESMNCGALEDGPTGRNSRGSCTCGADQWNARIDAALGEK